MSEELKLLKEIKAILTGIALLLLTGFAYLVAYLSDFMSVFSAIAVYGSYFTVPLAIWFIVRGLAGRCK